MHSVPASAIKPHGSRDGRRLALLLPDGIGEPDCGVPDSAGWGLATWTPLWPRIGVAAETVPLRARPAPPPTTSPAAGTRKPARLPPTSPNGTAATQPHDHARPRATELDAHQSTGAARHPMLGRCGLTRGHGADEPDDAAHGAHGACLSLTPPLCRRWDDDGQDWTEPDVTSYQPGRRADQR